MDKKLPTYDELLQRNKYLEEKIDKYTKQQELKLERNLAASKNVVRISSKVFFGSKLYDNANRFWDQWRRFLSSPTEEQWPEKATRNFLSSLLSRILRIGFIGILVALMPSIFLIIQTLLISNQNKLIKAQNNLFNIQNNLAESNRRAALVFELSGIIDQIDKELDENEVLLDKTEYKTIKNLEEHIRKTHLGEDGEVDVAYLTYDAVTRELTNSLKLSLETYPDYNEFYLIPQLSSRLEGRIIALSKAFKPYKYLNTRNDLVNRSLSPERGQLLISLIESGIALQNIIPKAA